MMLQVRFGLFISMVFSNIVLITLLAIEKERCFRKHIRSLKQQHIKSLPSLTDTTRPPVGKLVSVKNVNSDI